MAKIDDNWELDISTNCITLIEVRPTKKADAKNKLSRVERGYYSDVAQALQAYLLKSINPDKDVREILAKVEWAMEMIVKYKKENK